MNHFVKFVLIAVSLLVAWPVIAQDQASGNIAARIEVLPTVPVRA